MKIAAPLDSPREVAPLISAGADELYCGVYHRAWREAGAFSNARHTFYGNLRSFAELRRVVEAAGARGVPVYLCVNDHYPGEVTTLAEADIARGLEAGIEGLVLADPHLVQAARRRDPRCRIVLSSLSPCFNLEAVRFWRGLGVDRVVLPMSQLSVAETAALTSGARSLGVEVEAFVTNTTCKNVNGFCVYHALGIETFFTAAEASSYSRALGLARAGVSVLPGGVRDAVGKTLAGMKLGAAGACREPYRVTPQWRDGQERRRGESTRAVSEGDFAANYQGLCTIPALAQAGVDAGKIPGRGSPTRRKVADVRAVLAALDGVTR